MHSLVWVVINESRTVLKEAAAGYFVYRMRIFSWEGLRKATRTLRIAGQESDAERFEYVMRCWPLQRDVRSVLGPRHYILCSEASSLIFVLCNVPKCSELWVSAVAATNHCRGSAWLLRFRVDSFPKRNSKVACVAKEPKSHFQTEQNCVSVTI